MTDNYIVNCCVPDCHSNSKKDPTKIFIKLPKSVELEKQWTAAIGTNANYSIFQENSNLFFCEDHLNLPENIVNWSNIQNKLLKVKLDDDTLHNNESLKSTYLNVENPEILNLDPVIEEKTSLECSDKKTRKKTPIIKRCFMPKCTYTSQDIPKKTLIKLPTGKRIRRQVAHIFGEDKKQAVPHERVALTFCADHLDLSKKEIKNCIIFNKKTGSPNIIKRQDLFYVLSLLQNCNKLKKNKVNILRSTSGSDVSKLIKVDKKQKMKNNEDPIESEGINLVLIKETVDPHENDCNSNENIQNKSKKFKYEQPEKYDENVESSIPQLKDKITSIEETSSLYKSLNENENNSNDIDIKTEIIDDSFKSIYNLIETYPLKYTGIPDYIFTEFMSDIEKNTKLSCNNILLCLLQIRKNYLFEKLADLFEISKEEAVTIFIKSVPLIANYFKDNRNIWPEMNNELHLPDFIKLFRNIKIIIDCFEVDVEKPKEPQVALLLKNVKVNCYTMKYLISYSVDGLINFVSQGYGGFTTDDFILKDSKFLDQVPFSCSNSILTDENFNPTVFNENNWQILKLNDKKHVKQYKKCKDFKIFQDYIQCIMTRLREFKILSSHVNLNYDTASVLNSIVIIASALVNIQSFVKFNKRDFICCN